MNNSIYLIFLLFLVPSNNTKTSEYQTVELTS